MWVIVAEYVGIYRTRTKVFWQGGHGSRDYPFSSYYHDAYKYTTEKSARDAVRRIKKNYGHRYNNIKEVDNG